VIIKLIAYFSLFFSALLAATLIPFSSEGLLIALALQPEYKLFYLWAFATAGNVLGAVINWGLGYAFLHYQHHPRFPFNGKQIHSAKKLYQRYGFWSLLFCWLPIIGDPLSFMAGVMRFPWLPFVLLVSIGKGLRYVVVLYFVT